MSKNTAIAYPDGNRSRFFKGQDFINRARSFRDAAGVQYDAAAEVVGRLVTKEGRAQAAQDVLLTPFSTKHQHYFEAIQKFLKLKDQNGSLDNITIGEFKEFFKEFSASKDVLKEFVDTVLTEIKDPNEQKIESINSIISKMSSGNLAFGLKLRKSDKTPWSSIKDDKLATVQKVLEELLELIKGVAPVAVPVAVTVAVPVAVEVEESDDYDKGGSGVKRKKSKARTLKKKYFRRKTSKKRRQKKTIKKGDKKRRQKKASKKEDKKR